MKLTIINIDLKVAIIFIRLSRQRIDKIINRQKMNIINKMEKNIIKSLHNKVFRGY
jgi:hypothetical protein